MTKAQKELQKRIRTLRAKVDNLERQHLAKLCKVLEDLENSCKHAIVISKFGGARCAICERKDFGWYCPKSPDHLCNYMPPGDPDHCRHCGQPSERK